MLAAVDVACQKQDAAGCGENEYHANDSFLNVGPSTFGPCQQQRARKSGSERRDLNRNAFRLEVEMTGEGPGDAVHDGQYYARREQLAMGPAQWGSTANVSRRTRPTGYSGRRQDSSKRPRAHKADSCCNDSRRPAKEDAARRRSLDPHARGFRRYAAPKGGVIRALGTARRRSLDPHARGFRRYAAPKGGVIRALGP